MNITRPAVQQCIVGLIILDQDKKIPSRCNPVVCRLAYYQLGQLHAIALHC